MTMQDLKDIIEESSARYVDGYPDSVKDAAINTATNVIMDNFKDGAFPPDATESVGMLAGFFSEKFAELFFEKSWVGGEIPSRQEFMNMVKSSFRYAAKCTNRMNLLEAGAITVDDESAHPIEWRIQFADNELGRAAQETMAKMSKDDARERAIRRQQMYN